MIRVNDVDQMPASSLSFGVVYFCNVLYLPHSLSVACVMRIKAFHPSPAMLPNSQFTRERLSRENFNWTACNQGTLTLHDIVVDAKSHECSILSTGKCSPSEAKFYCSNLASSVTQILYVACWTIWWIFVTKIVFVGVYWVYFCFQLENRHWA